MARFQLQGRSSGTTHCVNHHCCSPCPQQDTRNDQQQARRKRARSVTTPQHAARSHNDLAYMTAELTHRSVVDLAARANRATPPLGLDDSPEGQDGAKPDGLVTGAPSVVNWVGNPSLWRWNSRARSRRGTRKRGAPAGAGGAGGWSTICQHENCVAQTGYECLTSKCGCNRKGDSGVDGAWRWWT